VKFIISGFHHIMIYDDGVKPQDININLTRPTTIQPGPPHINDTTDLLYRGLDPSVMPVLPPVPPPPAPPQVMRDRVEVVRFTKRGKFLVICGVLPFLRRGDRKVPHVRPREGQALEGRSRGSGATICHTSDWNRAA
jgi:hypothetical protein